MVRHAVRIVVAVAVSLVVLSLPVHAQDDQELADLRARAEAGDAEAQVRLGVVFALSSDVLQGDADSIAWFRKAAAQYHLEAQYILGVMYDGGRGLPPPEVVAKGVAIYSPAAEQGSAMAQLYVGLMYAKGHGVPQDNVTGHMWLTLAASRLTGEPLNGDLAVVARDVIAERMTREQLAEAQRRAREWDAAHP